MTFGPAERDDENYSLEPSPYEEESLVPDLVFSKLGNCSRLLLGFSGLHAGRVQLYTINAVDWHRSAPPIDRSLIPIVPAPFNLTVSLPERQKNCGTHRGTLLPHLPPRTCLIRRSPSRSRATIRLRHQISIQWQWAAATVVITIGGLETRAGVAAAEEPPTADPLHHIPPTATLAAAGPL